MSRERHSRTARTKNTEPYYYSFYWSKLRWRWTRLGRGQRFLHRRKWQQLWQSSSSVLPLRLAPQLSIPSHNQNVNGRIQSSIDSVGIYDGSRAMTQWGWPPGCSIFNGIFLLFTLRSVPTPAPAPNVVLSNGEGSAGTCTTASGETPISPAASASTPGAATRWSAWHTRSIVMPAHSHTSTQARGRMNYEEGGCMSMQYMTQYGLLGLPNLQGPAFLSGL